MDHILLQRPVIGPHLGQLSDHCYLQTGQLLGRTGKNRFTYRETEKYKAEEWITDEYALNKAKTKLVRGLAKWRRKTVDFADDIFMDVAVAFGAPDTRPKSEKKKRRRSTEAVYRCCCRSAGDWSRR